jgi:hypothetical protein
MNDILNFIVLYINLLVDLTPFIIAGLLAWILVKYTLSKHKKLAMTPEGRDRLRTMGYTEYEIRMLHLDN